jgi:IMP dehydrogenase
VPAYSEVLPRDTNTESLVSRNISLNIPLISASMDTVTEYELAIAMAQEGGLGIIHKNMGKAEQAEQIRKVKRSESGMITNPVTTTVEATVADVDALCGQFRVSGLPVIDANGLLVGIVTNRDMRFVPDADKPNITVREIMTHENLVTARVGVSREEAMSLLAKHKIEKLPIIDKSGKLTGLITTKDFDKSEQYPDATKDEAGRLRVGAAIGFFGDAWDRATLLLDAGVDVLVVDTANGESAGVLDIIKRIEINQVGLVTQRLVK